LLIPRGACPPRPKAKLQRATNTGRTRLTDWFFLLWAVIINVFFYWQFWDQIELRIRAVLRLWHS
jgi:hypothetical protein